MFTSALKSFSSNIDSNYTLSAQPSAVSGPWKIFDGKKKSTGKAVSVFIFDRKALDPHSGLGRSGGAALKKVHEEVIERLKKEGSSLARLRHPCILELVEPVEDTRYGGLMFATELITASLAGLLEDKDAQERVGGVGARTSRYVIEDHEGGRRRREVEIDELELQKGLLQIGKALEFLHESAGLVHGNLTPEAMFINSKGDWKVSGLGFSGPPENSSKPTSAFPISLSEVLHHDPRLPRSVQLNLNYTSPDFALDGQVTTSADMFSLGLLIVALYNSPHVSPISTNSSLSTYKKLFGSSSTTPSMNNQFLCSRPIPRELVSSVLPRLITRRAAQRLTAREFQESQYFDNVLVSTIRFLDSLPAKTPNEKAQFMRGLSRVLTQFPKSVLEKKVLPTLLEEMKDRDLLSLILQNVFKIIKIMPSGRRVFTESVIPRFREVFLQTPQQSKGASVERDSAKEAGLMVILENMATIADSCSAKDFKDHILPLIILTIESPSHAMVDASLRSLPIIITATDFTTVKIDLFPKIAAVFSKTSSLGIKVRGLEAFTILCGGSASSGKPRDDGLTGSAGDSAGKRPAKTSVLDKFTVQEKIIPLLKAIKTKEPGVMMAALEVFRQAGQIVDCDFVAMEILPSLWTLALGPLLNLKQFQSFMLLITSLSSRVEQEQTRKLQDLASTSTSESRNEQTDDFMSFNTITGTNDINDSNGDGDFEQLVLGKQGGSNSTSQENIRNGSWGASAPAASSASTNDKTSGAAVFSWSTSEQVMPSKSATTSLTQPGPTFRSITPDLSSFATLKPSGAPTMQSLQPQSQQAQPWSSSASATQSDPWASPRSTSSPSLSTFGNMSNALPISLPYQQSPGISNPIASAFAIPPPPATGVFQQPMQPQAMRTFNIPPPPMRVRGPTIPPGNNNTKSGLDKYESLI